MSAQVLAFRRRSPLPIRPDRSWRAGLSQVVSLPAKVPPRLLRALRTMGRAQHRAAAARRALDDVQQQQTAALRELDATVRERRDAPAHQAALVALARTRDRLAREQAECRDREAELAQAAVDYRVLRMRLEGLDRRLLEVLQPQARRRALRQAAIEDRERIVRCLLASAQKAS